MRSGFGRRITASKTLRFVNSLMAKARPEKRQEKKPAKLPDDQRSLPMQLKIGDRIVEETGLWEVIAWPSLSGDAKTTHVGVRRVARPDVIEVRSWGAHERVSVRRA
jgi:hypothetical protein